ncbi:type IV secretion system protein VirD4 [Luteibacter sp. 22Crub2.1]|nr:type IV secretion system protein VirD4 [Luteibacter sp. 22Crub2.1]
MHWKAKFCLGLTLLFAAVAGALYLSGFLTLTLIGVQTKLTWNLWWLYWQAIALPQYAPYVWKIQLAGAVGFIVPLAAWIAILVPLLKTKPLALHGDSRFARRSDLAKAGLLKKSPNGIVVGKFGSQLVRLSGQQFVILAAPTRSGKGVGVVIPNLLEYQESMVVLDIKQENFDLTSGWRRSQGQEIYLFNPFAEDRRTHRWNPLSYVSPKPSFRISDIQSIAAMLYPDGDDAQKFWVSQARNAFTAFTLYLFENYDVEWRLNVARESLRFPTLGEVYRLSSGDGRDLRAYLRGLSEKTFLSREAKRAFANLLSQAEETFASIMGTFKEPLNAWINPVLDAATSDNDFLLTDVRKKRMTIYIGIQPNKLAESRLIINLFFSQLINVNTRELPQNNPDLKHQCLLLMDEFTSIGKVEILASSVSYMAGYNIRLLPIIQSMAQLDATYGKDVSRTIITNHAMQIIYAPREQQDANDYSDMLGYTTVRKESVSKGRERSVSHSDERRALMLPQELKAMGTDKEVILFEGIPHPVKCDKIRYYEDRRFTSRLLKRVDVPALRIDEVLGMANKKVTLTAAAGLAVAGLFQGAVAEAPATQTHISPPRAATAHQKTTELVGRFVEFVKGLKAPSDITPANLEKALAIRLDHGDRNYGYTGPTLDGGWSFSILFLAPDGPTKAVVLMFENNDVSASSAPACLMDLESTRAAWRAAGYRESEDRGEIGQFLALLYYKSDVEVNIDARRILVDGERKCIGMVTVTG